MFPLRGWEVCSTSILLPAERENYFDREILRIFGQVLGPIKIAPLEGAVDTVGNDSNAARRTLDSDLDRGID